MKRKITLLIIYTFILRFCFACIDVFEIDLTEKNVELLAPSDGLITDVTSHIFWWSDVKGALGYELQIVSPDFSNISILKVDTILETDNFKFMLQPGNYHWRVRAFNGASSSVFTESELIVIESLK